MPDSAKDIFKGWQVELAEINDGFGLLPYLARITQTHENQRESTYKGEETKKTRHALIIGYPLQSLSGRGSPLRLRVAGS